MDIFLKLATDFKIVREKLFPFLTSFWYFLNFKFLWKKTMLKWLKLFGFILSLNFLMIKCALRFFGDKLHVGLLGGKFTGKYKISSFFTALWKRRNFSSKRHFWWLKMTFWCSPISIYAFTVQKVVYKFSENFQIVLQHFSNVK